MLLPSSSIPKVSALLTALVCLAAAVLADTEIRNFQLPLPLPSTEAIHPSSILELPYSAVPHILNVSHHETDMWVRTPLHGGYKRWTARISWPASTPTKFDMHILSAPRTDQSIDEVLIHLNASLLSPRFPRQPFSNGPLIPLTNEFQTTFALVIEPLIFGVVPQTAIPAICWSLVFGIGAACVVPYIIRYLDTVNAAVPRNVGAKVLDKKR